VSSKQPYMPFFFGDFLAATATWDGEEQSLYILLLAYQWSSGPLPAEPSRIAKMCRYDRKRFDQLWQTVSSQRPPGAAPRAGQRDIKQAGRCWIKRRLCVKAKTDFCSIKGGEFAQANGKQLLSKCFVFV
jgi:hypothetical protein